MDDNLVAVDIVHQSALLHVLRRIWVRVADFPAFSSDAQGSEQMLESEIISFCVSVIRCIIHRVLWTSLQSVAATDLLSPSSC